MVYYKLVSRNAKTMYVLKVWQKLTRIEQILRFVNHLRMEIILNTYVYECSTLFSYKN